MAVNRCTCPIDESLGCVVNHTARVTQTFLMRSLAARGLDITVEQFKIMVFLWSNDAPSQQEIADFVGKDKASITRLLAGLEKRNLITRIECCSDKRTNRIHLTPEGIAMETPIRAFLDQTKRFIHAHFDPADVAVTLNVLKQLCTLLDDDSTIL